MKFKVCRSGLVKCIWEIPDRDKNREADPLISGLLGPVGLRILSYDPPVAALPPMDFSDLGVITSNLLRKSISALRAMVLKGKKNGKKDSNL